MIADEESVVRRDRAVVEDRERRFQLRRPLVRPIIGRFCGYFTSGRSPLSNGSVTVSSANALRRTEARGQRRHAGAFHHSRLSSIALPPKLFVSRSSPDSIRQVSHGQIESIDAFARCTGTFALQQRETESPGRAGDRGFRTERLRPDQYADVHRPPAEAERASRAGHVAAVVIAATDEAEPEAVAAVVMMVMRPQSHTARRSGGGASAIRQRSSGNKETIYETWSFSEYPCSVVVLARVSVSVYPSPICRLRHKSGFRQFPEQLFRLKNITQASNRYRQSGFRRLRFARH